MAIVLGSNHGRTNGVTPVEVVGRGGDNVRAVRFISVYNADTVAIDVTLYKIVGVTNYLVDRQPALPSGQTWRPIDGSDVFFLANGNESLELVLAGAKATNDADFTSSFLDT